MCGSVYWLALPLVLAVAVAEDRTTCGRTTDEIEWSFSSVGETPCAMWWAVIAKCFPGWVLETLIDDPTFQHYEPGTDPCTCSSLSYNLMAACTWCQHEDFGFNWLTEKAWFAKSCPESGQPIEPLNVTLGRSFPRWAFASNHGSQWDPKIAKAIALTPSRSTTARPSDTLKSTASNHTSTLVDPTASQARVPPHGRLMTPSLPTSTTSGEQIPTANNIAHRPPGTSLGNPAMQTSDQTSESKTGSDPSHVTIIAVAAAGAVLGSLVLIGLACCVRRRRTSGISPISLADISVPMGNRTTSLELLSTAGYAPLEDAREPPPIYSPATGSLTQRLK